MVSLLTNRERAPCLQTACCCRSSTPPNVKELANSELIHLAPIARLCQSSFLRTSCQQATTPRPFRGSAASRKRPNLCAKSCACVTGSVTGSVTQPLLGQHPDGRWRVGVVSCCPKIVPELGQIQVSRGHQQFLSNRAEPFSGYSIAVDA